MSHRVRSIVLVLTVMLTSCASAVVPDEVPVRLLAPLSTSTVTSHTPTLRFLGGLGPASVEVCLDRACSRVEQSLPVALLGGRGQVRPTRALTPGVHYWRVRGGASMSAVWEFRVTARDAQNDTSWGTRFDVNGDGYDDLAVMAASASQPGLTHVHVYLGTPAGLATTPQVTLASDDDGFGTYLASAGDVNGDGFGDLAVGDGNDTVCVFFGGISGLASTPGATMPIPHGAAISGALALAGVGDLNGDGFADIVVGAPQFPFAAYLLLIYEWPPHVFVFEGGVGGPHVTPDVVLGTPAGSLFGGSVLGPGDLDGDGFADLVVSSPTDRDVLVYRGRYEGLDPIPRATIATTAPLDPTSRFDGDMGTGDVDGDGHADLALQWFADAGSPAPVAHVGVHVGDGRSFEAADLSLTTERALRFEARFLASVGDLNGDGFDDLALGMDPTNRVGEVDLLYGGGEQSGAEGAIARLYGTDGPNAGFGACLAPASDLDGDGYDDFVTSAFGTQRGRVYIFRGSSAGASATPSLVLSPERDDTLFGACVL